MGTLKCSDGGTLHTLITGRARCETSVLKEQSLLEDVELIKKALREGASLRQLEDYFEIDRGRIDSFIKINKLDIIAAAPYPHYTTTKIYMLGKDQILNFDKPFNITYRYAVQGVYIPWKRYVELLEKSGESHA